MFLKAAKFITKLLIYHPKGWLNLIFNQLSALVGLTYVFALPVHITIEPTNLCDQKCPVCETGAGILDRSRGMLSLENFKKIIDKIYPHTNTIMFYFMGEPFLNKDAYEMIKYAKLKDIFITCCTNGNFIDGKKLIYSGIDEINFQIGGTTQETHEIYRVNGNLKKIFDNVREAVKRKKETGAKTEIILGFIIMKHNEHQLDDFWKLVKELGVDRGDIVSPCVRNFEQEKIFLTRNEKYWLYDKKAFEERVF